ncbi:hypothetical protein EDB92DRAFT_1308477 [Lactarius akahatsu]|uniref:Uncharacterized protein n=1 Tax=Lactarius akahatsu TaxID=416441 RepID=A0AAD4LSB5_9AGAM|nr:hypothetical protein EDB92DRAFT_1308477 [Lactarius akahatsu]
MSPLTGTRTNGPKNVAFSPLLRGLKVATLYWMMASETWPSSTQKQRRQKLDLFPTRRPTLTQIHLSAEVEIDYFGSASGRLQDDHELRYADFFDAPNSGAAKKSEDRPFASAHSKVRFHDQVKVKTIKARGKGLPVSTMRLLDDASDDDSWEVESKDEDDNDLEGAIWDHVLDGGSDMVFGGGGDESGEGNSTFDGYHHQTFAR